MTDKSIGDMKTFSGGADKPSGYTLAPGRLAATGATDLRTLAE